MTKRALTILVIAVLLVGGATAVIASSLGGGDASPATHVMPNGQSMNGDRMDGSSMHTMPNDETMPDSDMDR